jgi:GH43 family beta-xylosidase
MRATIQKSTLAVVVALFGIDCYGQSNVYSSSVHTRWTVGAYPAKFGLEGYRKDAAGYYILANGSSVVGKITGKPLWSIEARAMVC